VTAVSVLAFRGRRGRFRGDRELASVIDASAMTDQEIALLRELCRSDHMAYIPQGSSTTALRQFDGLVLALYGMKKMGWIELEVEKGGKAVKGYKQKYRAVAARCTKHGREALRMLGEG
jgi:hypothetical protein